MFVKFVDEEGTEVLPPTRMDRIPQAGEEVEVGATAAVYAVVAKAVRTVSWHRPRLGETAYVSQVTVRLVPGADKTPKRTTVARSGGRGRKEVVAE